MRTPRLLPSVAVGQALGILLADWADLSAAAAVPASSAALFVGAAALFACVLSAQVIPLEWRAALGAALAAGLLHAAMLGAASEDRARVAGSIGRARTFDACVQSAELRAAGPRYVLAGIRAADGGGELPKRAEWFPLSAGPRVGECLRLRARLRAIRGYANPGAPDRARSKGRRGLAVRLTLVGDRWAVRTRLAPRSPRNALADFRLRVANRLLAGGRAGGLVAALSLGDRRGLDPADRDAFAELGIAHVLAVSGLHLMLVAGLAFALARLGLGALARGFPRFARFDVRILSLCAAAAVATVYALLSGPGVAALRAWLVVVSAAGGFVLGRPDAVRSGFWLAATILLAWDPAALFDLGAQLSFGATGALLYSAADRVERAESTRWSTLFDWGRDALRASSSAIAATTPFLAASDLETTPVGLVANLVAIPWVGFVLLPASFVVAGLHVLPAWGVATEAVELATLLALAAARSTLDVVAVASAGLPALPGSAPPAALALGLSAGAALASIRSASTRWRLSLCLLCIAMARLPSSYAVSPFSENERPRFVAFDVGSGDALYLSAGSASVLVDGGLALDAGPASSTGFDLGEREVLPALRFLGVRQLDLVIATHADADHVGGLPSILRALRVEELWLPVGRSADAGFDATLLAARERGVRIREVGRGTPLERLDPALTLEVLWPPSEVASRSASRNDDSLVIRARLGAMRILLAGDLSERGERRLLASARSAELEADVLKVGHHGSATSSSARWLSAVSPSIAVLSARCGRAGLPSARAVERLRATGAALWWTGAHGAVSVRPSSGPGTPVVVTSTRLGGAFGVPRFDGGCVVR